MALEHMTCPQRDADDLNVLLIERLSREEDALTLAACEELGLPRSFVQEQLAYVASCLATLGPWRGVDPAGLAAAFLFPSNTEGAMPIYLLALAGALGLRVHAQLSRSCPRIQAALAHIFEGMNRITFHAGTGRVFLSSMLADPQVRFIQVFGDDNWIGGYAEAIRASGKMVAFEGPGKDPFIVLADADLAPAVRGAVASGLFAGGAACMSAERFLVHQDLLDPFLQALVQHLAPIAPMPPTHPKAVLGYVYSGRAAGRIRAQIEDAVQHGARLLLGGQIAPVEFAGRQFYACAPTVLRDVAPGCRVVTEETFGPVFPVQSFATPDEAIALAEDCPYGLTAMVFGVERPAHAVAHRLRASHAVVYVNETMLEGFQPDYWGCGGYRRSGWLAERGADGTFRVRAGYRPLRHELARILHATEAR